MAYHLYVSNAGSEWLSHFVMDEQTGALEPQENIQLGASPGAAATNTDQSLMFVALRSQKRLASYRIDQDTGSLTPLSTAALEDGPPYIYTDNTDRYLLASYYRSGGVSVHRIEDDGTIAPQAQQWLETDTHAHSIQTDRSNRFVFVPHTNPANAIFQFKFDQDTGLLTPNEPAKIQPDTPEGPRHFAFHPQRDLLYSVNENGSTVSAHHFDSQAGTLQSFQVISTLPEGFAKDKNTTAEIEITPDGKHLYASNRGHNSLAHFTIGDDGSLSAGAHFATEATPRFFALDPSGSFLCSAGQASDRLIVFKIDTATGILEPLEIYPVGKSPLWIQFIRKA